MTDTSRPGEPQSPTETPAVLSPWQRVQRLFHEALERRPEERGAYLADLATHDPPAADEVRSLLEAHLEASGFLDTPIVSPFQRTAAPGEKIGPYRIVEEIGRGGMGVVYRAVRDDDDFTKEVAIKWIDPGMRSEMILKRFRAERQILALLDHPHIARLLDGGTAADGSPYLVMEYVSGTPLLQYCDEHHLGIDERLSIFLAVCDAVQFAHQRLVVHRDLKSDNILVTEDRSPRLLDFGIAKLLSPEGGMPIGTLTAPMQRMLTPDYASPEQVRGEPATVAGDVYSLGVVLYELLSGARPYRFTTRTPAEILWVIEQMDPPLPSSVAGRADAEESARRRGDTTRHLRRKLAGDLDYVAMKAVEKDPSRRYGSVEQLAQDLRRHLDGRPVLARGRSTAYLVSRFVRRHRVAVVTTAVIVATVLAGFAGTMWQARVASIERDKANRRFQEVRELARAVMFDIHDAIANLPGSTKAREALVEHGLRYLDQLSREAKGDVGLQHELGVGYGKIGDVQGRPMFPNLGQTKEALASYDKALALLSEAFAAAPDSTNTLHDWAVVMQRRSDLLRVMGRHQEAMQQAVMARDRVRQELAKRPNDPMFLDDFGVATDRLADMKLAAADTLGAIEERTIHLAQTERSFRLDPTSAGSRRAALIGYAKMANLRAMRGETDSALVFYRRAEQLARDAVTALPENTDALRDLSIVYGMQGLFFADGGQFDSAFVVYERGMKIAEDLAAADPNNALQQSDVAAGHFEIGTMLVKAGRHRDAIDRFREAYDRYQRLAEADSSNAENRMQMARSARAAGEACAKLSQRSGGEREAWRSRGLEWLERSLGQYRTLAKSGALEGEEESAPKEVAQSIAALR